MKITTVFLITLQLSLWVKNANAQSVKISLNLNNATIEQVLNEIEAKSNYYFLFNQKLVDVTRKVNIEVDNVSVFDVLSKLFVGQDVDYVVIEHQIIIAPKDNIKAIGSLEKRIIMGKVSDSATDTPIPGVNVVVEGQNTATVTDSYGIYAIEVNQASEYLIFSYVGYATGRIYVKDKNHIHVTLMPDIKKLDEVVVMGYGTSRKSDLTGAASNIKVKDLNTVASPTIDNMLQGRVSGLNMLVNSAQPGGAMSVNIRGAISPRGNNAPLFVIDGVPLIDNRSIEPSIMDKDLGYYGGIDRDPLCSLNPSDIESVDVLKDASACAIYGSSAANGVILITTKKGKVGKPKVEYSFNYSVQTPKKYFDLLNAKDFMAQSNRLSYDKYLFDNSLPPYGNESPNSAPLYSPLFSESAISQSGVGTNWLDMLIRKGFISEHNIALTGGSDKTQIYTSFNYYNNKAILENSDFIRYSGRLNIDQAINNRIKATVKAAFSQTNSNNASTGSNSGGVEKYNMLQAAYAFTPTLPVYDSNGDYSRSFDRLLTNPAAFLIINDKLKSNRFFISPALEIEIVNNLTANIVGGMDRNTSSRNFYLPVKVQNAQLPQGMAQLSTSRMDNYSLEGYITYKHDFKRSDLNIVLGAGNYYTVNDGFGLQGVGFFTDVLEANNVGIADTKIKNIIQSYKYDRTRLSQFLRVNYSFDNKYLLTIVARRDGSSMFSPNYKSAFFPGFSLGWRMHHEKFLKYIKGISELKVRIGFGSSGNESVLIGNIAKKYSPGFQYAIGNTIYNGVALSQMPNNSLKWETNYTQNAGIDFAFWESRLTGTFDYFIRTAKDLLDYLPQPSNNAVGLVAANVGSTRSTGYELALNSRNIVSNNFSWKTTFALTSYKVFWVKRNKMITLSDYVGENDALNAFYGWKTDGIIKSESDIPSHMPYANLGNIKYVDLNRDGILDSKDVTILGNADPKYGFGLNNIISYKNLDFSMFIYGFLKKWAYYGYNPYNVGVQTTPSNAMPYTFTNPNPKISTSTPNNTLTSIKDVWTYDNTNGNLPGIAPDNYVGSNPSLLNDFGLMDASFARIKNITLGYRIPVAWAKGNLSQARVYIDFQNVAVITKYKGFDPEYTGVNPYPQAFTTTVGLLAHF